MAKFNQGWCFAIQVIGFIRVPQKLITREASESMRHKLTESMLETYKGEAEVALTPYWSSGLRPHCTVQAMMADTGFNSAAAIL